MLLLLRELLLVRVWAHDSRKILEVRVVLLGILPAMATLALQPTFDLAGVSLKVKVECAFELRRIDHVVVRITTRHLMQVFVSGLRIQIV